METAQLQIQKLESLEDIQMLIPKDVIVINSYDYYDTRGSHHPVLVEKSYADSSMHVLMRHRFDENTIYRCVLNLIEVPREYSFSQGELRIHNRHIIPNRIFTSDDYVAANILLKENGL
jgi:hypothetical protein